jgi:metal-responsive CopG/Arc/MetJ family transcriptional regulator
MNTKSKIAEKPKPTLRTSVTFPPELYDTLEQMAKKKKVSVAWIVRDATEQYVANETPLFGRRSA